MAETLTVAELIVSDIEPQTCADCLKKVIKPEVKYLIDQTDADEVSPAECANLILESFRRCREHNNCPRTDKNAFTARPC